MPDIIEFPANLKITDRTDPELEFNTRSGGVGIDGTEQILSPLSERWRFVAIVPIFNVGQARSIRVIKSRLKGRFNYLLLRLCDPYRISRKDVGAWAENDAVPHSDGALFSDDSGYALSQPISPIMAPAAANTSLVSVRASDFAGAMSSGVFFSINYWLYHVDNWDLVDDNYVLQISPPLQQNITTADEADFSAPCIWRLDADNIGTLDLKMGKFGSVILNLVEPVGR